MSNHRLATFNMLLELHRSLKLYGLNPHDWQLDHGTDLSTGYVAIRHRDDHDFVLKGNWSVRDEEPRLRQLAVASI